MAEVEIELTDRERDRMIHLFVNTRLRKESKEVYVENMSNLKDALYAAVLNDSCIDCIEAGIEAETHKKDIVVNRYTLSYEDEDTMSMSLEVSISLTEEIQPKTIGDTITSAVENAYEDSIYKELLKKYMQTIDETEEGASTYYIEYGNFTEEETKLLDSITREIDDV